MIRYLFLKSTLVVLLFNFTLFFCQGQNPTNNTLKMAQNTIISHFQKKGIPFDWNLYSFKKTIKDGNVGVTFKSHYEYEILKPQFSKIPWQNLNWLFTAIEQNTDKVRIFNLAGVELENYNCRNLQRILNGNCIKDNDTINISWHSSYLYRKDFLLSYVCANYILTDSENKMGIIDSEGNLLLPVAYDKITHAGGNLFITYADAMSTKFQIFDINKKEEILKGDEIKKFYSRNKEKTYSNHQSLIFDQEELLAVRNNENWQLLNSKLELIYSDTITEIYEVDDHLIVKNNSGYSILNKKGELLLDKVFNYITNVLKDGDNLAYATIAYINGIPECALYNDRNIVLTKWVNGTLHKDKNYISYISGHTKDKSTNRKIIAYLSESEDGKIGKVIYENFEMESIEIK
ncbi:MAG: hypothetical protein WAS72_01515 [Saprospiraceae bacterium]